MKSSTTCGVESVESSEIITSSMKIPLILEEIMEFNRLVMFTSSLYEGIPMVIPSISLLVQT